MLKLTPSAIERYSLCPGAFHVEKLIGWQEQSSAAEEGNLLHDAMAGVTPEKPLTSEQKRLVSECVARGKELNAKYLGPGAKYQKERRIQIIHEKGGWILSGKEDWVGIDFATYTALVLDWKFGYQSVEDPESNLQLRCYAVMTATEYGFLETPEARVIVAIVQPTVFQSAQVQVVEYGMEEIAAATTEITRIREAISAAETVTNRVPGAEQCKYCKALGTDLCPESQEMAQQLIPAKLMDVMPTGEDLALWLDRAKVAESLIKRIREHAMEQIASGYTIPGWTVTKAIPIRTLPNTQAVWERVAEILPAAEFIALTKIGVGDLQEALAAKLGWRAKDAKDEFNTLLGASIQMEEKEGSLKKVEVTKEGDEVPRLPLREAPPAPVQSGLLVAIESFRAADKWARLKQFGTLKDRLQKLTGDESEYRRLLSLSGVNKCDEFKTLAKALDCYKTVWLAVEALDVALAEPPPIQVTAWPDPPPEAA